MYCGIHKSDVETRVPARGEHQNGAAESSRKTECNLQQTTVRFNAKARDSPNTYVVDIVITGVEKSLGRHPNELLDVPHPHWVT